MSKKCIIKVNATNILHKVWLQSNWTCLTKFSARQSTFLKEKMSVVKVNVTNIIKSLKRLNLSVKIFYQLIYYLLKKNENAFPNLRFSIARFKCIVKINCDRCDFTRSKYK